MGIRRHDRRQKAEQMTEADEALYDRLTSERRAADEAVDVVALIEAAALAGKNTADAARRAHADRDARPGLIRGLDAALQEVQERIVSEMADGEHALPRLHGDPPDTAVELRERVQAAFERDERNRRAGRERIEEKQASQAAWEAVNAAKGEHTRRFEERRDPSAPWVNALETFRPEDYLDEETMLILRPTPKGRYGQGAFGIAGRALAATTLGEDNGE
jgi:hypothetical protein